MSTDTIRASLHEIAVETGDVQAMREYYGRSFGYAFKEDEEGVIGTALDRRLRLVEGSPKTLSRVCFGVSDAIELAELAARLDRAGAPYRYCAWPGMVGGAVEVADPDGNCFVFGEVEAALPSAGSGDAGNLPARLQHVVFASRDAGRLIDFYQHALGFTMSDRVVDGEGGLRTAFLRCSHEHHSLAVFYAPEDRLDHHCFEVGEWSLIRDWADHFAAHHVPLKWGPGRHGPGNNLFMFIHDPDGNWLELSAELEQVEADRPVGEWRHEERTLNSWGMGLLRS